jgi:uncharacterized protein YfaS (alpha-2-macroglobulin family)
MRIQTLLVLLCFLFSATPLWAQTPQADAYQKQWGKIDSLLDGGLPKSAATLVEQLRKNAIQQKNMIQKLKAELYELRIARSTVEDADSINIKKAEAHIHESEFPLNALWQSVTAQLYWGYYEQNRYSILRRSRLAEPDPNDWSTWDAQAFVEKTSTLYEQSLSHSEQLKALPIRPYDPILIEGENSRNLRPTLYDFLAFRALAFFTNDERDLTKPSYQFVMDDAAAFAPAAEFAKHHSQTKDTASLHYHSLLIYQELLRLHAEDKEADALLDADLSRLEFVYKHSVHPDKKSLYQIALRAIEKNYPQNPLSALAAFRVVKLELDEDASDGHDWDNPEDLVDHDSSKVDLRKIKAELDDIVTRFPYSEGGTAAAALRQSITAPSLSVTTEEVNLPDEPFRVLIKYRNLDSAWLRVVRLSEEQFLDGIQNRDQDAYSKYLSLQAVHESGTQLPGSEDFAGHRAEYGMPALPVGLYAVLISSGKSFSTEKNTISVAFFQSTRLAEVTTPGAIPANFVLDRKDGTPVKKTLVSFLKSSWNGETRKYTNTFGRDTYTGADGSFKLTSARDYSSGLRIVKENDRFITTGYFSYYRDRGSREKSEQTLLFTDRSIYRPGQTIYFKGILLQSNADRREHGVVAGRKLNLVFYDVNRQKIAEQIIVTNEWGSVSGKFTAPESGLTGQMRIECENGAVYFSVEEYKRPSFKLGWDTLKTDYVLNENVSITGFAQAYAGYPLDGAQVRYRVVRETHFPYEWYSWRWRRNIANQEIVEGTTTTNAQGKFIVPFKTIPDLTVDASTSPVFSYVVTADVVDQNGETHSGNQTVHAGYRSIQISLTLPQQATPGELDSIDIRTQNLNGTFVSTNVTVRIARLQSPSVLYRKRVWETPDQFLMNETEFHKLFPIDPYRDEDDYHNWKDAEKVVDQNIQTKASETFHVPKNTFSKNGWYRISIIAKDKNGAEVEERKFVQVWDPQSNSKPVSTLIVAPQSQTSEPGNKVVVSAGSAQQQLYVLRVFQQIDTNEQRGYLIEGKTLDWTKALTEADRGGMSLSFISIKENRAYVANTKIDVPWSNKELSIEWGSHRSELEPGSSETWTLKIIGNKKDKVAAEVLAGMYDASLDAFGEHRWRLPFLFPYHYARPVSPAQPGFAASGSRTINTVFLPPIVGYEKSYDRLIEIGSGRYFGEVMYSMSAGVSEDRAMAAPAPAGNARSAMKKDISVEANEPGARHISLEEPEPQAPVNVPVRTNFQETAFFFPQLHTDAEGAVSLSFRLPEALTEWKLLALAHTKDLSTGTFEGKITTRKQLMVQPNLPRFLRQGDDMFVSTKVVNQSLKTRDAEVTLEIVDAMTGQALALPFKLTQPNQKVTIEKGASKAVSWRVHVPDARYEPVLIRIRASSEGLSDGEEHVLPVLTKRILVTESMPLWMNGPGTKDYRFEKLLNSASDAGLAQHSVVLEYTGNPAWNVVKSLPYLMEFPYECSEQIFNRFYANELAAFILQQSPNVKEVFRKWETESLLSSFMSPLEHNQELKSALLEETPWVLDAQNESEQRKNIAKLFNSSQLEREQNRALKKMQERQLPEGGWSWFPGANRPDRYITQYIVTGIGRLKHLGISDPRLDVLADRALTYLEREMMEQYKDLIRRKANLNEQQISRSDVQYLYLTSFFPNYKERYLSAAARKFYLDQAKKYWPNFNPYQKGMIALALNRSGEKTQSATILQSLRETAQQKEELGMYWMEFGRSWWWWELPIETQSLLIEAFSEVGNDMTSVSAMKRWLLKQKQTQSWSSTKSTADACYALLLRGSDWLRVNPEIRVQLGDTTIDSRSMDAEAGTGYIKTQFTPTQIKPEMGKIQVNVTSKGQTKDLPSWGAVYWQYFQDQDKVTAAATPLKIERQLLVERNTASGPVLENVTGNLKVGDKVKVRITVRVDRDMEYVHLKDGRPSCLEPIDVHSGYQWGTGMGYYQSTRDLATHFFIDYLPKGVHVFEYSLFATQAGDFSAGLATVQCMYAPEFGAHSAGVRLKVE